MQCWMWLTPVVGVVVLVQVPACVGKVGAAHHHSVHNVGHIGHLNKECSVYVGEIIELLLTPIAMKVPFGIAMAGSFRSPLMLAPAVIPVTAGKKTANTVQKLSPLSTGRVLCRVAGAWTLYL